MPLVDRFRGTRARALATGAVVALAACTATEDLRGSDSAVAFDEVVPDPVVGEVSAPASAGVPVGMPDVWVAYEIDDPASFTVVVTKRRPLNPLGYVPADLVDLGEVPGGGGQRLRAMAAQAMIAMYADALAAGAPFRISTAYRAYGFQESLYAGYVATFGRAGADRSSARPGFSEHQTGLAADVYDTEANRLKTSFAASTAGVWLAAHAHEYGYIISYPDGKQSVTGFKWEPWHVRFVGVEVATSMREQGFVTLQEFMGVEASPDYG